MTLLSYQVLKTVADQGSFRKAAELLGLTPSAVSHAVSSMEKELGFFVFNRGKNGVMLTNYGERLLPRRYGGRAGERAGGRKTVQNDSRRCGDGSRKTVAIR